MITAANAFSRFVHPLVGWFIRHGMDEDTAKDLTQQVWLVVVEKDIHDTDERRFGGYVFAVARRELLWHWERWRRFRENVAPTLMVFGSSTPIAVCRYCGEPIRQYGDYRSEGVCLMHYTRLRRGSNLTKPKARRFTDDEVRNVRALLASGMSGVEVARRTGMGQSQVSRIRNNHQRCIP